MEKLILLLVFAAIALAKKFLDSRSASSAEEPWEPMKPAEPPPLRPAQDVSEEERMRKFFEALGIPQTTTPPPTSVPPKPRAQLPRTAPQRAKQQPSRRAVFPTQPQVAQTQIKAEPAPKVSVPSAAKSEPEPPLAPASTGIRGRLQARDSIREAIILREILGPPRAMQSFDSPSFLAH